MRRYAAWIFAVAFIVRLAVLASPMTPASWILAGGHAEVDAVARSLASTGRYADPYVIPTGPTAHPLPIHTALQALIVLGFGDTATTAWVRSCVGLVAFAGSLALLPWWSARIGLGRRVGCAAGIVGAAIPAYGIPDLLGWLWNESMAAMALAALSVAFLSRWQRDEPPSPTRSLRLGVLAGVTFHLAPSLLVVVVGYVVFEAWRNRGRRRWVPLTALALGALLACAPWAWRTHRSLGQVFFIRSNFGLELRLGNHDGARADVWRGPETRAMHPGNNLGEARLVRDLGEAAYMARQRDAAIGWIREHPGAFLRLTAGRIWLVWFGPPASLPAAAATSALTVLALLGLRRAVRTLSAPQLAVVVIPLVAYPLVYYFVGYVQRYLFPLHGVLLVLAAFEVRGWIGSVSQSPGSGVIVSSAQRSASSTVSARHPPER